MNDTKLQIKQHVDVSKEKYPSLIVRFEEDIDYVESNVLFVSSHIPFVEAYEQMQKMSTKLESIERSFANAIKICTQTKTTKKQLKKMSKKISNQKEEIFKKSFKKLKKEFKADFDYAESIQLPEITGAMSQSDIEISYENAKLIHTRLKLFLSKLNDRLCEKIQRYAKKCQVRTDVAGSSIGLQSERSSPLQDQSIAIENSKPITYDDLSTQTDFTPRITITSFRKYEFILENCTDPKSHLSKLERLFEHTKESNQAIFNNYQRKIDCLLEDFKIKALKKKDKIKFDVNELSDFYLLMKGYRKTGVIPNKTEIMTAVKSHSSDSSDGFILLI